MKQRWVRAVVAVLMCSLILMAGCGRGPSDSGGASQPPPAGQQQETPSGGDQTGEIPAKAALKVAVVYNSVAEDLSWSHALHAGLKRLQAEGRIEYAFSENVATADVERFLRRYAERGHDLVVAHSSVYKDAVFRVAKEFPDVNFAWPSFGGKDTAENVAAYDTPVWEASYLAGIVAARITKTNTLGFVGGIELPGCKAILNGFRDGARSVNPDLEVHSVYVGDFNDVSKAKGLAISLIDRGADVLSICGNGPARGTIGAAQERDVYAIGYVYDMSSLAPDHVLGSLFWDGGLGMEQLLDDIAGGQFRPAKYYPGKAAEGITTFKLNSQVADALPAEAVTELESAVNQLTAGELELNISFE